MPVSRKTFPYFSKSLPSPDSPHNNAGGNAGGNHQGQPQRRLTRQRKLRHVTDDEVGIFKFNCKDRPCSLPGWPDKVARKLRSPDGSEHWSSSAVPKPLPLPEVQNRKYKTSDSGPGPSQLASPDGLVPALGRKNADHAAESTVAKSSVNPRKGLPQDEPIESIANGPKPKGTTRNPGTNFLSTTAGPHRSNAQDYFYSDDGVDSNKSLLSRRNFASADHNLRLDVPFRSAPTTALSSPSVSPRRSIVDPFRSCSPGPPELRGLIDLDAPDLRRAAAYTSAMSPVKTVHTPDHSPLHSPGRNKISFASHNKSLTDNNREWHENNTQVNAHPLPLPPGALPSSQSPMPRPSPVSNHIIEKPIATPKISRWLKGKRIGRGTYGSVYEATNRETGALCAMKEVDIIPDDPKSVECIKQLEQEIKVLQHLKHQNIVQYYGSEIVGDHFYIFLEYVHPGSINKYVRQHCGAITESVVRNFTRHILHGLAYLHSSQTIHRDIKGANLLVDSSGVVKLADFGMAIHLTGLSYELSLKGSPYWMAPEVIMAVMQKDANRNHALAVDIWSLGCTVIEMFIGKPPWNELTGPQAMFKVLNRIPEIPEALSSEGKDFLQCCFRRNPAERPSAAMLLEHPFVRNSADLNGSTLMQDKSHSPRNSPAHQIDLMSTGRGTRITNRKLPCNSDSPSSGSVKTMNCATAFHHPFYSPLEGSTYTPPTKLIHGSHSFSPSTHVSSHMTLGVVNNHPCAVERTQGKEVPYI